MNKNIACSVLLIFSCFFVGCDSSNNDNPKAQPEPILDTFNNVHLLQPLPDDVKNNNSGNTSFKGYAQYRQDAFKIKLVSFLGTDVETIKYCIDQNDGLVKNINILIKNDAVDALKKNMVKKFGTPRHGCKRTIFLDDGKSAVFDLSRWINDKFTLELGAKEEKTSGLSWVNIQTNEFLQQTDSNQINPKGIKNINTECNDSK